MDAREIFAQLRADGWSLLENWKADGATESVTLDFKEVRADMTQKDSLSVEDRDGLAKNISGFANTNGGVLVFGVEARSVAKGPDVVQALKPIRGLAKFADLVRTGAKSLVEPVVAGVDVLPIVSPGDRDTGALAVFVPRSPGGPHRATGGTSDVKDRYFMRTADSTTVMPHRMLAALFAAPPEPKLVLTITLARAPTRMDALLRNDGPGSARAVRVKVHLFNEIGDFVGSLGAPAGTGHTWQVRERAMHLVDSRRIYPEETVHAGILDFRPEVPFAARFISARVDTDRGRSIILTKEPIDFGDRIIASVDGVTRETGATAPPVARPFHAPGE